MTATAAPPRHIQATAARPHHAAGAPRGSPTDFAEPLATPAVTVPVTVIESYDSYEGYSLGFHVFNQQWSPATISAAIGLLFYSLARISLIVSGGP